TAGQRLFLTTLKKKKQPAGLAKDGVEGSNTQMLQSLARAQSHHS
ncbi:Uncharacterized protein APZ42_003199, partial [Daphnia magna]